MKRVLPYKAVFWDASGTLFKPDIHSSVGVSLYPDANEIVSHLRARGSHFKTGIITNWGKKIHRVVHELGLDDCFDSIVSYDDLQLGKPRKEIFELAATLVGVPAPECCHVGDSYLDDYMGAKGAGMAAYWLDRLAERTPNVVVNDDEVLSSLQDFLEKVEFP